MKKQKGYILIGIIIIIALLVYLIIKNSHIPDKNIQKYNRPICDSLVNKLKSIDNPDDFDITWIENSSFNMSDKNCSTINCICNEAWNLYLNNIIIKANIKLDEGLISSAYSEIKGYISDNKIIKDYYNNHELFKLISGRDKEQLTDITASYGRWIWNSDKTFKFNKDEVNDNSKYMKLNFEDSEDQLLINGQLKPINHPDWNSGDDFVFDWYSYKIINNIIYIKPTSEDNKYESIFEILKITDTSLSLKLIMDLEDVDSGQIYNFDYKYVLNKKS